METAETILTARVQSNARTVHIDDITPSEAYDRVMDALEHAGFSVLAEIDLADLLRRRTDREIEPHFVLEVCRAELASRALDVSSEASLLMPCKIAIWQEGKGAAVGMLPPTRLAQALGREHLAAVAAEAEQRLVSVLEAVSRQAPRRPPRTRLLPTARFALDDGERNALIAAVRSRVEALLAEAAGTEKRELQHDLARDIDELEAILRKLGAAN
jgi:uncharacterized protein (DUF302 family)